MSATTMPGQQAVAIDPRCVPCPCCGDLPWCPQEVALAAAEVEAAPELTISERGGDLR